MDILFYLGIFILFFVGLNIIQRELVKGGLGIFHRYNKQCVKILEDIFLPLPDKTTANIIAGLVSAFAALGFFLPGTVLDFNVLSLDRAVNMNTYGKHKDALDILNNFREVSSPLVYNEIGVARLGMGDYGDAISSFNKAITLKNDYAQAHANLAHAYALTGREVDAKLEMRRAYALSKFITDPAVVYGLQGNLISNLPIRIFSMFFFGVAGWCLPLQIFKYMQKRRVNQFNDMLPDGLVMATNGLRAGMSLGQVLEVLSREAPKPLNQEFGLIVKQQQLGKGFNESLEGLKTRIPTDDVTILVNSISILREVGGNLTDVFENLADTIRERKMIKQKISTMTAEGKTQAIILTILPFILGWILNKLNPEVFSLMYTTPLGWAIILFMFIWGMIGCFFMWKIVHVKV